jgi:5-methylcytosine-specific restriction endonuclease McrA
MISLDQLWKRDRGVCGICQRIVALNEATRDHIKPRSLGGSDNESNIQLAHRMCNNKRGSQPLPDTPVRSPVRIRVIKLPTREGRNPYGVL